MKTQLREFVDSWDRMSATAVFAGMDGENAVLMSVGLADMKDAKERIAKIFEDKDDPRRQYVAALSCSEANGLPGGVVRLEFNPDFTDDSVAHVAALSILRGEKKKRYAEGKTPVQVAVAQLRRPWPDYMPKRHYFGLETGPNASHGGRYLADRPDIIAIQDRLRELDFDSGDSDGIFDDDVFAAVSSWQYRDHAMGRTRFGEVWADDWANLFTY